jgi:hypothetical protein
MAVVQIPRGLPRLVRLPGPESRREYVLLGDLIGANLPDLLAFLRTASSSQLPASSAPHQTDDRWIWTVAAGSRKLAAGKQEK